MHCAGILRTCSTQCQSAWAVILCYCLLLYMQNVCVKTLRKEAAPLNCMIQTSCSITARYGSAAGLPMQPPRYAICVVIYSRPLYNAEAVPASLLRAVPRRHRSRKHKKIFDNFLQDLYNCLPKNCKFTTMHS